MLSLRSKHQFNASITQLEKINFCVAGFQEARRPRTGKRIVHDPVSGKPALLITSAAHDNKCLGCAIIISMSRPFFFKGKKPVNICKDDVLILHASPRILLVVISCRAGKFAIASLHSPHQSCSEHREWWASRTAILSGIRMPMIICGDLNTTMSEVWAIHSSMFGEFKRLPSNTVMTPLVNGFLDQLTLWMPAAERSMWLDGQSELSFVARGCRSVNDYIIVSSSVACVPGSLHVWHEYDSSNKADDHLPVIGLFQLIPVKVQPLIHRGHISYDRQGHKDPAKAQHFESLISMIPPIPFSLEPSSHFHLIEESIKAAAVCAFPRQPACKKNQIMSDSTFQLVLQRGRLRKRMRRDGRRNAVAHALVNASIIFWCWAAVANRLSVQVSVKTQLYALWDLQIDRALCSCTVDALTDEIQKHVDADLNTYVQSRKQFVHNASCDISTQHLFLLCGRFARPVRRMPVLFGIFRGA